MGTNRVKTDREIAQAAVTGIDAIKPTLGELKPGEMVIISGTWKTGAPPKDQVNQVRGYGKKIGVKMQGQ
jgi:hypothetical protein